MLLSDLSSTSTLFDSVVIIVKINIVKSIIVKLISIHFIFYNFVITIDIQTFGSHVGKRDLKKRLLLSPLLCMRLSIYNDTYS